MKNVILISLLLIITNAITYWLSDKIKLIFLKNEVPIIGIDNIEGSRNASAIINPGWNTNAFLYKWKARW